jgi:hypothetical protein
MKWIQGAVTVALFVQLAKHRVAWLLSRFSNSVARTPLFTQEEEYFRFSKNFDQEENNRSLTAKKEKRKKKKRALAIASRHTVCHPRFEV